MRAAVCVSASELNFACILPVSGAVVGEQSSPSAGLPDCINPSFLAALTKDIRKEIGTHSSRYIDEQMELQRIQEEVMAIAYGKGWPWTP
jgi:hypothetical protein